jgi:large subunit ribosomal protein L15
VPGTEITADSLYAAGIITRLDQPAKILGTGEPGRAFTVRGLPVSASAKAKIEAAGGKVEA